MFRKSTTMSFFYEKVVAINGSTQRIDGPWQNISSNWKTVGLSVLEPKPMRIKRFVREGKMMGRLLEFMVFTTYRGRNTMFLTDLPRSEPFFTPTKQSKKA